MLAVSFHRAHSFLVNGKVPRMSFLIALLIMVLVLGLVIGLLIFAIRQMTFMPAPFQSIAIAIVCLIACIILIGALTGQLDFPMGIDFRRR